MLKRIKDLFKKKEKIGLTLDKLEPWFDEKTHNAYEDIEKKLNTIKENVQEEVEKARESIKNLQSAELHNNKITIKEKQFMEGSRDFYTKRISIFLDSIKIPEEGVDEFIEKLENDIHALSKSTLKAYNILQHFFKNEAYKVAQHIRILDNQLTELNNNLSDKKIKNISKIKEKIKSLKTTIEKEIKLKQNLETIEKSIIELEKNKKSILSEISHKEQSPEYKEYHRLEVDKYKIHEQVDELKDEILHYFSTLEHALKKHAKLHPEVEDFLNKYIEDPLKALIDDYKIDIKHILEKVEENIHTKKIELKDKKKEKTLQVLNKINEVKLASFLTEYNAFMVEMRNIEERLKNHTILDDIEDIKIKLKDKKEEIEKISDNIKTTKEELENIDINKIKDKIKEKIDDLLNIELNLD